MDVKLLPPKVWGNYLQSMQGLFTKVCKYFRPESLELYGKEWMQPNGLLANRELNVRLNRNKTLTDMSADSKLFYFRKILKICILKKVRILKNPKVCIFCKDELLGRLWSRV